MNTKINQERVKILRLGKSWTQQRLADIAKISLRSVQRVENEGVTSLQSRAAIASAFGIEPTELEFECVPQISISVLVLTLAIFSYASFYIALVIFDINLEIFPAWSIPIIPSLTILIFGYILQTSTTRKNRSLLTAIGCIFLAMLLSPPEPVSQIGFIVATWVLLEVTRYVVSHFLENTQPSTAATR